MSSWLINLDSQLTKDDLGSFKLTENISEIDIENFVNLWLTEGIPFAFKDKPYLYQLIRSKLAEGLEIHAKDISLVGSARTGFSFHKFDENKNLKDFSTTAGSDLDLFIVSKDYFDKIVDEIKDWLNNKEQKVQTIIRQKNFGFLDTWHIPNTHIVTKKINSCATTLNSWLHENNYPVINQKPKWAGVRIYKDWQAVTKQNSLNLRKLGNYSC
jgi:hypothetical protein